MPSSPLFQFPIFDTLTMAWAALPILSFSLSSPHPPPALSHSHLPFVHINMHLNVMVVDAYVRALRG